MIYLKVSQKHLVAGSSYLSLLNFLLFADIVVSVEEVCGVSIMPHSLNSLLLKWVFFDIEDCLCCVVLDLGRPLRYVFLDPCQLLNRL